MNGSFVSIETPVFLRVSFRLPPHSPTAKPNYHIHAYAEFDSNLYMP